MSHSTDLESTLQRIRRMEDMFDLLLQALSADPNSLREDPAFQAVLEELTAYYDSPQWLADYESDERGEFPSDLKRGVLSQDAVYELLWDIRRLSADDLS